MVATGVLQAAVAPCPLGLQLGPELCLDPTRQGSAQFLRRLERLDRIVYGPFAMAMPRWAFYDCAELPGLVCGFACEADAMPARLRETAWLDAVDGPVPLSMCVTLPTLDPGRWLTYVLCDVHEALPGLTPPSLRVLSLALACALTGARNMQAVTQWASSKLAALARFAPLRLDAAWVPAHSLAATCVVSFDADSPAIERALEASEPQLPSRPRWLDVGNARGLEALQRELEAGAELHILGPPRHRGAALCVPLSQREQGSV